ncbi:hypothetical protein ACOSP7_019156 [Xanthoceras sorbifolium]
MHPSNVRTPLPRPGRLPPISPPTQILLQHLEYNERYERFSKRTIIQERGVAMDELSNMFVPMVVHHKGWQKFIQQPIQANSAIVLEFYASMICDDFLTSGPVMVRGQLVFMSVEAINEYFGLETDPSLVDGLTAYPHFTHYNEELAKDLWSSGKTTWNSRSAILRHAEL